MSQFPEFMMKVGRGSCPIQRRRAARLPPSVASTSLVASSLQPPAFGPVLHEGTSFVRGGEWLLESRYRVVHEPFPPHAHNFPTAHSHRVGRRAVNAVPPTSCSPPHVLSALPSLFYLPPHARVRAPRSHPTLALPFHPIAKSGARCFRAPPPRRTGTPVEPELAVACVLAGGPIPGRGGA